MSQNQKRDNPSVRNRKQNNAADNAKKSVADTKKSNGGVVIQQSNTHLQHQSAATGISKKKSQIKTNKDKERAEREGLVLWRCPIQTIKFCSLEITALIQIYSKKLLQQRRLLAALLVLSIVLSVIYNIPGPHQVIIAIIRKNTWFFIYWVGLGVLSSVGLGTGLHTFLLYLGPHIASVTLAAYECNSLNFPKPPYPDDIQRFLLLLYKTKKCGYGFLDVVTIYKLHVLNMSSLNLEENLVNDTYGEILIYWVTPSHAFIICPDEPYIKRTPDIWSIMTKVRLEAFLWGAGTALGELPPYFMAKAARLSGYDPEDDEDIAAFEELKAKRNQKNLSIMDRGKLFMERVVERIGFFGILACASIPNPLFDLAGITCGHFLVPFWTFFGATLIGKAIVKMHLQKVFVIIAFNESLIERAVDLLEVIPVFGGKLQEPFKGFLNNQKQRLHRQRNVAPTESGNMLSKIFESFVIFMVCYFVVSIVNSLAQSYHKRIHKKSALTASKKTKKFVAKD